MVGIRLTITWQCDMVVNPVDRHSGHSALRPRAGQTNRASDY